jgi:hypothetical protein
VDRSGHARHHGHGHRKEDRQPSNATEDTSRMFVGVVPELWIAQSGGNAEAVPIVRWNGAPDERPGQTDEKKADGQIEQQRKNYETDGAVPNASLPASPENERWRTTSPSRPAGG